MNVPLFQAFARELVARGILSATELAQLKQRAKSENLDFAEVVWHRIKDDSDLRRRFADALAAANVVMPEQVEPDFTAYGHYSPDTWRQVRALPVRYQGEPLVATPTPFSPGVRQIMEDTSVQGVAFIPPEGLDSLREQFETADALAAEADELVAEIFMPEVGFDEEEEPRREELMASLLQDLIRPEELLDTPEGKHPEHVLFEQLSPDQSNEAFRRLYEDWRQRTGYGEVLEYRENLDGIALERVQSPEVYREAHFVPARTPEGQPVYITYHPYAGEILERFEEIEPRPFILVPPALWERLARRVFDAAPGRRSESLAEILASMGRQVPEEVLLRCRQMDDEACAELLLEAGVADDETIAQAKAQKYGLRYVALGRTPPAEDLPGRFDPALLRRLKALPHSYDEEHATLFVAVANPNTDLAPLATRAPEGLAIESIIPVVANEQLLLELLPPVPIERSPLTEYLLEAKRRGAQRVYMILRGTRGQISAIPEEVELPPLKAGQVRDLEAEIRRLLKSGRLTLPVEGNPILVGRSVERNGRTETWLTAYLAPVPKAGPHSDFHAFFAQALKRPAPYLIRTADPLAIREFLLGEAKKLDRGRVLWVGYAPIEAERVVWVDITEGELDPLAHMPFAWAVVEDARVQFPQAPYPVFLIAPGLATSTSLEPSKEVAAEVLG